ncbi:hypothetical protein LVJ94_30355 [Pendulispora rubella]|uniref:Uncharacterized protein n=1 Tax=Pendulispora rubella TaxID=2741070 RepID=A0ABZ2KT33_9BACT
MPSLKEVLKGTMLFTAARGVGLDPKFTDPIRVEPSKDISFPDPNPVLSTSDEANQANPIWHWRHDAKRPSVFSNIRCWPRGGGMNYQMPMLVLESLEWGVNGRAIAEVTPEGASTTLELPLTLEFMVHKFFLKSGHVEKASTGLWQLESLTDVSMLMVFVYEQHASGIRVVNAPTCDMLGESFMPSGTASFEAQIGEALQVKVSPPRFVVCLSLTCCKERADFDPFGALVAGRIYPHAMILSNRALRRAAVEVRYKRPTVTSMPAPNMTNNIGAGFFTDTNNVVELPKIGPLVSGLGLVPYWSEIFDYYDANPRPGSRNRVVHAKRIETRTATKAVQRLRERTNEDPIGALTLIAKAPIDPLASHPAQNASPVFSHYETESITKMPHQGAFDNLHLAVGMKAFPGSVSDPAYADPKWQLTDIRMAPICEHDCLHTHWRWGQSWRSLLPPVADPKTIAGFGPGNEAYREVGSPLVPLNQNVDIVLESPASFRYCAEALSAKSGVWQVFMHHGSAYALAIAAGGTVAALDAVVAGRSDSPLRYWNLRWHATIDGPQERVKPVGSIEALKEL